MDKKDIKEILHKLLTAFPSSTRFFDAEKIKGIADLWLEFFKDEQPRMMKRAVNIYIANNDEFPTIHKMYEALDIAKRTLKYKYILDKERDIMIQEIDENQENW